MGGQFAKLYTDSADMVISSEGMTANAMRLFLWLMRHARDGGQLDGRDAASLAEWAERNGMACDVGNVQTASFSLLAASEIFGGSKTEAKRQVARLVGCGVLDRAGSPARGHAQLYVINPSRYTPGCAPNGGFPQDECTPERAPYPNGCTSSGNGCTSDGEWVHIQPRIGTHAEPVSRDGETPLYIHQTITSEGGAADAAAGDAAPPRPACPRCGSTDGVRQSGSLLTCACGTAWRG